MAQPSMRNTPETSSSHRESILASYLYHLGINKSINLEIYCTKTLKYKGFSEVPGTCCPQLQPIRGHLPGVWEALASCSVYSLASSLNVHPSSVALVSSWVSGPPQTQKEEASVILPPRLQGLDVLPPRHLSSNRRPHFLKKNNAALSSLAPDCLTLRSSAPQPPGARESCLESLPSPLLHMEDRKQDFPYLLVTQSSCLNC